MKLYNYWRSSCSYRVRLALHHKQLAFEYVAVNLLAGEQHQPAHRARSPLGTVPVLEVEDAGQTVLVTQSVAIAEYLEERFPEHPLFPHERPARATMRALVESINSGIQPLQNLGVTAYVRDVVKGDEKAWAKHWIAKGLGELETLAQATAGTFLVGDAFSWADCCLVPQLFASRRFGVDPQAYPTLARVELAVQALPAFTKARPEAQPDAVA